MSTMQRKALEADIVGGKRGFTARITTSAVDRDGEVLLPEGMIATDYERNPVVFWNHDTNRPLGKAIKLVREKSAWVAEAEFAARPDGHEGEWFPDTVHALMQQGVVRGVSVGFLPIGSPRKPSSKDVELFGPDVRAVYPRWKLLEFSVAPLPANQDALVTAVTKGIASRESVQQLFGVDVPETKPAPRKAVFFLTRPAAAQPVAPTEIIRRSVEVAVAKQAGRLTL